MNYKELQAQLKKFISLGYNVNCKLNSKKDVLQAEYDRIINAEQEAYDHDMDIEMGIEEQVAYQDSPIRDGQPIGYYVNNLEKSKQELEKLNTPTVFKPRNRKLIRKGRKNLSIIKALYA